MEKRQEILLAAHECFMKYGYGKTSMSDIGRMVQLNKASLYYHFKDKISLYREVVMMHRQEHQFELKERMKSLPTYHERIRLFIIEEIHFSQKISGFLVAGSSIIQEVKSETRVVYDEIISQDIRYVEELLKEGIMNREFITCDTHKIAVTILTMADSLFQVNCPLFMDQSEREKAYQLIREQLDFMLTLVLNGILTIRK